MLFMPFIVMFLVHLVIITKWSSCEH